VHSAVQGAIGVMVTSKPEAIEGAQRDGSYARWKALPRLKRVGRALLAQSPKAEGLESTGKAEGDRSMRTRALGQGTRLGQDDAAGEGPDLVDDISTRVESLLEHAQSDREAVLLAALAAAGSIAGDAAYEAVEAGLSSSVRTLLAQSDAGKESLDASVVAGVLEAEEQLAIMVEAGHMSQEESNAAAEAVAHALEDGMTNAVHSQTALVTQAQKGGSTVQTRAKPVLERVALAASERCLARSGVLKSPSTARNSLRTSALEILASRKLSPEPRVPSPEVSDAKSSEEARWAQLEFLDTQIKEFKDREAGLESRQRDKADELSLLSTKIQIRSLELLREEKLRSAEKGSREARVHERGLAEGFARRDAAESARRTRDLGKEEEEREMERELEARVSAAVERAIPRQVMERARMEVASASKPRDDLEARISAAIDRVMPQELRDSLLAQSNLPGSDPVDRQLSFTPAGDRRGIASSDADAGHSASPKKASSGWTVLVASSSAAAAGCEAALQFLFSRVGVSKEASVGAVRAGEEAAWQLLRARHRSGELSKKEMDICLQFAERALSEAVDHLTRDHATHSAIHTAQLAQPAEQAAALAALLGIARPLSEAVLEVMSMEEAWNTESLAPSLVGTPRGASNAGQSAVRREAGPQIIFSAAEVEAAQEVGEEAMDAAVDALVHQSDIRPGAVSRSLDAGRREATHQLSVLVKGGELTQEEADGVVEAVRSAVREAIDVMVTSEPEAIEGAQRDGSHARWKALPRLKQVGRALLAQSLKAEGLECAGKAEGDRSMRARALGQGAARLSHADAVAKARRPEGSALKRLPSMKAAGHVVKHAVENNVPMNFAGSSTGEHINTEAEAEAAQEVGEDAVEARRPEGSALKRLPSMKAAGHVVRHAVENNVPMNFAGSSTRDYINVEAEAEAAQEVGEDAVEAALGALVDQSGLDASAVDAAFVAGKNETDALVKDLIDGGELTKEEADEVREEVNSAVLEAVELIVASEPEAIERAQKDGARAKWRALPRLKQVGRALARQSLAADGLQVAGKAEGDRSRRQRALLSRASRQRSTPSRLS